MFQGDPKESSRGLLPPARTPLNSSLQGCFVVPLGLSGGLQSLHLYNGGRVRKPRIPSSDSPGPLLLN